MHFHLALCAPPRYHPAVIISEAVVPDLLVRILPENENMGPPEVADKDRWYTANLSQSHGVRPVSSLRSYVPLAFVNERESPFNSIALAIIFAQDSHRVELSLGSVLPCEIPKNWWYN
jgi:hypothetical protein